MKKIVFILLIFNHSLLIIYSQVSQQWVARYNGPANFGDYGKDITIDAAGNVYVIGSSYNSRATDYVTIKYNSDGIQQWAARYNGPANGYDNPTTIAVDVSGNVYVTGRSENSIGAFQMTTIKYYPSGVQHWVQRYDSISGSADYGKYLTLDQDGNAYVAGGSMNGPLYTDLNIIKYSPSGVILWIARYRGSGHHYAGAHWIELDRAGYIYVTGTSIQDSSGYNDYLTVKYNSEGILQWARTCFEQATSIAYTLAVDNSGNIVVAGTSFFSVSAYDYATIKYNSSGNQQWVQTYNGQKSSLDVASSIAVDTNANIYLAGFSNGPMSQYALLKYNSSGIQQWVRRYSNINSSEPYPRIALDKQGNVYVCGKRYSDTNMDDYLTVKFDPSGNQIWEITYNGPGNKSDNANAIAIDNAGNVYVTGASSPGGLTYDIATIKYSQIVGVNPVSTDIPANYNLYQNYPNPFNPSTKIKFSVPSGKFDIPQDSRLRGNDNVVLKVYDILGNEVSTLVNEQLKPGTYEVEWDARFAGSSSEFSSGVYYYTLQTESYKETKKMILIK
jgi:uncharacterized delta-60 repeat protein